MLELIKVNIAQHGHHIYLISGESLPRYAYTIGMSPSLGFELILPGAIFYSADEIKQIVNSISAQLRRQNSKQDVSFIVETLGAFSLRKIDKSWATSLMLGALDYYNVKVIHALQIVPESANWTIDIPDLSKPWSAIAEPIWRWLYEPWSYAVEFTSVAVTNLSALRGERITEAMRWEKDQWEIFAGSGADVAKQDMRVVPLGVLLAVLDTPEVITDLKVGGGVLRDADSSEWSSWD